MPDRCCRLLLDPITPWCLESSGSGKDGLTDVENLGARGLTICHVCRDCTQFVVIWIPTSLMDISHISQFEMSSS